MKSFVGVLIAVGILAVIVGILWMRHKVMSGAQRKRSKREFVKREADRDRRAVQVATRSRSVGDSAPRDNFSIPESRPGGPAGTSPPQSLQNAVESRRRSSTSTSFDPDLPSS
jgi:hypothetical protein